MSKMGSHVPFGHFKHKLWPKKRLKINLTIWLSTTKSPESPWFPYVWHTIGKLSMKATTLAKTSFQSEVYTQSYGPPKLWESELWEFRNSHLGIPGQNDIWVPVPWPNIKYTIRGEVVASPKSKPWWILWIYVCPWFIYAPKCSSYALTNLLLVCVGPCE
jgi:hypothetical protein